jgi:cyclic pyranopterin monophosphate synthase
LTKMFDPASTMFGICLVEKEGGKSGHWKNTLEKKVFAKNPLELKTETSLMKNGLAKLQKSVSFSVLTISDSCFRNPQDDLTGPHMIQYLKEQGANLVRSEIVADNVDEILLHLEKSIEDCAVIFLTGGTGLGPRDFTPFAVQKFSTLHNGFEIPGIGELLRRKGAEQTQMACLSRSGAYCVGKSMIFSFPGSKKAVEQGLELCVPLIEHMLAVRQGARH